MSLRALLGSLVLVSSLPLTAATFTVTSGADSGPGTLRQAILDANANPGRDQIVFRTDVSLELPLPAITGPVDVSGARTPSGRYRISALELSLLRALRFEDGSAGSTVRSLELDRGAMIDLASTDVTVTDVRIVGESQLVIPGNDNTVGGPAAGDANEIITLVIDGDRNRVFRTTVEDFQLFSAADTVIGAAGAGNEVLRLWVRDSSSGTVIEGNTITHLILQNTTGAPSRVAGNVFPNETSVNIQVLRSPGAVIRDNTLAGTIGVFADASTGVAITGNTFGGATPINLDRGAATFNDPAPDADTGANGWQNFPVITFARLTPEMLLVEGTLTSAPLTPYEIEVFSAGVPVGTDMVTTDAAGQAAFTVSVDNPSVAPGAPITATATNRALVATPGNFPSSTSVMSPAAGVVVQPGLLGFDPAAYTVDEADGTVTITVRRTAGSDGTVTVDFATSDATATAPEDYTASSGTLTFGPGVTEQAFTVPITADAAAEVRETFTVALTGATGGAAIGTGSAPVSITDAALAAAQVPSLSTWGLIALVLGLAWIGLRR